MDNGSIEPLPKSPSEDDDYYYHYGRRQRNVMEASIEDENVIASHVEDENVSNINEEDVSNSYEEDFSSKHSKNPNVKVKRQRGRPECLQKTKKVKDKRLRIEIAMLKEMMERSEIKKERFGSKRKINLRNFYQTWEFNTRSHGGDPNCPNSDKMWRMWKHKQFSSPLPVKTRHKYFPLACPRKIQISRTPKVQYERSYPGVDHMNLIQVIGNPAHIHQPIMSRRPMEILMKG
ncbi:unnamed protein product [Lepeophtheirus salmonis]|uniref:(salmon louse) hypothetical protein n=1 Tax=Lepeophtheirus salmonis TaxID=72036 RepID=A0A7R8CZ08_LEPSM|nr:unnamed protein product [Lepeophtheirus salmonis]CAF2945966.1 unnamed protein product [Lepeophtheirus salmonis]